MFYGDRLLTTDNPEESDDQLLFSRLDIQAEKSSKGLVESNKDKLIA